MSYSGQLRPQPIVHKLQLKQINQDTGTSSVFMDLPTEMVDLLCATMSRVELVTLMLVCQRLHFVASRILYRSVTLSRAAIRYEFFRAISTQTPSCRKYASLVKRVKLMYQPMGELYDDMVCQTMLLMDEVIDLEISVPSYGCERLLNCMCRYGIITSSPRNNQPELANNIAMSKLTSLSVTGDMQLTQLARSRLIDTLALVDIEGEQELLEAQANLSIGDRANTDLRSMTLRFWTEDFHTVLFALHRLADWAPELRELRILCSRINALVLSHVLTSPRFVLPHLERLHVNTWFSPFTPRFIQSESECMDVQQKQLVGAKETLPSLKLFALGDVEWRKRGLNEWSKIGQVCRRNKLKDGGHGALYYDVQELNAYIEKNVL